MNDTIHSEMRTYAPAQYGENSLNKYELKSVRALITYVAYAKNISEDAVGKFLRTEFGVFEITTLRQRDYDDVIRFLVDLKPDAALG